MNVERWGVVPYGEAIERQQQLAEEVGGGLQPATLILLEHPSTITLGLRGDAAADLLWPADRIAASGYAVHRSNRGGQATAHGPGQLVLWLVSRPALGRRALPKVVDAIESLAIDTCATWGVRLESRRDAVGLWTMDAPRRKVASLGLRFAHGVTTHGMALNVTNDEGLFDPIRACGFGAEVMCRLIDLVEEAQPPTLPEVADRIVQLAADAGRWSCILGGDARNSEIPA